MDFDAIQDAHDKGLIIFQHEDLIAEMVRDRRNWGKVSLALANSTLVKPLDKLDLAIMYRETTN